ncbi:class I SAM-dependent methyltransferase [Halobacteriales archaeon QS_1_67_19]|nr:MAG: class I SAM-dependent methyltransferase [Halobacteriales archaeon QS_1_67_19]
MEEKAREWWNAWADEFQDEHSGPAIAFGVGAPSGDDLGLLGDLDGANAIELGCGGAQFGVALAERGADVTGVDISEAQLDHARELAAEHDVEIEFVEASVTDMPSIPDATYDLAFSSWAFQWVQDLEACFAEAHRVLEEGGRFVFSVDHPYYKTLDPETGAPERSYFSDEPRREYVERFDAEMVVYSRKVSEIVNTLLDVGFDIEELREPGHEDPEAYENEFGSFRPELMATVPPTLVVAARK